LRGHLSEVAAAEAPVARRARFQPLGSGGWRGGLREFLIIVAGVLVALAAQAWWQQRDNRAREHDYLRQLLDETRQNEDRISDALGFDSAVYAMQSRLVQAFRSPGPLPPNDSLAAWMVGTLASSNLQLLTGTYEAIVSAGDLRLLQTDTLRAQVIRYAAALENGQAMMRLLLQQALTTATPFARRVPFVRDVFAQGPPADPEFDFAAHRNDDELGGLLFTLQAMQQSRVIHLGRMLSTTRATRAMLEAESALQGAH
jgi:hypothetical protein